MLNVDTKMYEINMPISQNYHILTIYNQNIKKNKSIPQVLMIAITEQEEDLIDNIKDSTLILHRGNRTFNITNNQIFCYGKVDFNDKETLNTIDNFKFLNHLGAVGIQVYSKYNYETHSCISPKRHPLWTETWSPAFLAKFAHASLGKPKRILLFKQN